MDRPFFSIIIPTKNRSFLVGHAIRSVLQQTFDNFEIVVADNDDSAHTQRVVASFSDPRLRYFRTGDLSMPDNWEFGSRQAQGDFITILADKQALKSWALARLHALILTTQCKVAVWRLDKLDNTYFPPVLYPAYGTGDTHLVASDQILSDFLNRDHYSHATRMLPLSLNSCVHHSVVEQSRQGPAERLHLPTNPDYTGAFLQLAYSDRILVVDEALAAMSRKYGNGKSLQVKGATGKDFLRGISSQDELFHSYVPIKATFVISNLVYNDFMKVRSLVGGKLLKYDLNLFNYFVQCYRDIYGSINQGVDMRDEETAWHTALAEQEPSIRQAVREAIAREGIVCKPLPFLARVLRRLTGLAQDWRMNEFWFLLRKSTIQQRPEPPVFKNVLEYVEWDAKRKSA